MIIYESRIYLSSHSEDIFTDIFAIYEISV